MSNDVREQRPSVFADGYSYAELVPVTEAAQDAPAGSFVLIFHPLFTTLDEPTEKATDKPDSSAA